MDEAMYMIEHDGKGGDVIVTVGVVDHYLHKKHEKEMNNERKKDFSVFSSACCDDF
jgi:hypothetical protein